MFSADDWNKYLAQGRIDEYAQTLSDFEKNVNYEQFQLKFNNGLKYLTGDQKLLAMQNELYGDNKELVKKKKTITKADGSTYDKEYETTEQSYVKSLLDEQIAYNRAIALTNEAKGLEYTKNTFGNAMKAIPQNLITGAISGVGFLYNIVEGLNNALLTLDDYLKGNTYLRYEYWDANMDTNVEMDVFTAMDKAFRAAFTETGWDEEAVKWIEETVFLYEEGDYAYGLARYTASAANSLGRMLPGLLLGGLGKIIPTAASALSKTAQATYYISMAGGEMQELFRDETMCTRPTLELVCNAVVKTAFEYGVERALGKAFGTTTLDNMAFGYGTKAGSSITTKNALARIGKDALQEGMEEYLQDFSTYMVDRVFGIWAEDYKGCSEWTLQGAVDAFVLGAAMSIGGSMLRVATTKRVSTGEINEKTGKYKKFNKLKSYEYNMTLQSLFDQYNEVDLSKMDQKERVSTVTGFYTTVRAITALYGEFGEQRLQAAQKILERVQNNEPVTTADVQNSVSKLVLELQIGKERFEKIEAETKLDNIMAIERIIKGQERKNARELAEALEQNKFAGKTAKIKKDATKQEIKEAFDVTERVAATLERIMNGTGKDVILVEKGTGLVETSDTVIIAQQCAEDFDADTNMRTLSEQRIVSVVLSDIELSSLFSGIRSVLVGPNGTEYTPRQFMTMLLYDENFAYSVLYNGDKDLVRLISRLDYIASFLAKDRKVDEITAKDIKLIRERLKKVLYNYYRGASYVPEADIEQSTILTKSEKRQLKADRWQKGIYGRVVEQGQLPTDEDLAVLDIMLNAYKADEETKAKLKRELHSNDIAIVKVAFNKLVTQFETNFKGVYNGHQYLEYDGNPLKAEFNMFLRNHGVRIDEILNGIIEPDIAEDIAKTQGSVTPAACVKYFQELYQNEYHHTFTPDFKNGTVIVSEGEARVVGTKQSVRRATDLSASPDYDAPTSLVKKSYDLKYNIFAKDITKFQRVNATIDDVIKDDRLLSDAVKADVKNKYGDNSPMHTFLYLRDYILDKSNGTETILVDNNGNYYIATIEGSEKVAGEKFKDDTAFAEIQKVIDDVLVDPVDGSEEISIEGLISKKYLDVLPKDRRPTVLIEAMSYTDNGNAVIDRRTNGMYDDYTNTIVINANVFKQAGNGVSAKEAMAYNKRFLRWILLHEFRHVLQVSNGMTLGFGDFLPQIAAKNKKAVEAIIKDLRKHFPTVFGKEYNYKRDLQKAEQILYLLSGGETNAIGYEQELGIYPIAIQRTSTGRLKKIITPWGTEYDASGVVGQNVSKSLKVSKEAGYTVNVNNLFNNSEWLDKLERNIRVQIAIATKNLGRDLAFTKRACAVIKQKMANNLLMLQNMSGVQKAQFWKSVEQELGEKLTTNAKLAWETYGNSDAKNKFIREHFPLLSNTEAENSFVPVVILTIDNGANSTQYTIIDSNAGVKNAIRSLRQDGYLKGNPTVRLTFANLQVRSLIDGTLINDNTVKLRGNPIMTPLTKTYEVTDKIGEKPITVIGGPDVSEFIDKVYSKRTNPSEVAKAHNRIGYLNIDMLNYIESHPNDTYEDFYNAEMATIEINGDRYYNTLPPGEMTKAEFNKQYDQYMRDVFDIQHSKKLSRYMWDSGAVSPNDPRRKMGIKTDLLAEIKSDPAMFKKMVNIARFIISPWLSYDEFLDLPMPFIRIATRTEQAGRPDDPFAAVSFGTTNFITQLGLGIPENKPVKMYMGVAKPRDAVGFTPTGEYEGLLPDTVIYKAEPFTMVQVNGQFYLLGEEYRDIQEQIMGVDMFSMEGKPLDTTFSFSKNFDNRTRYVSHEDAQNSNLRYYVLPGTVLQMDPRMQDINIASTGIEDTLDYHFVKAIKNGKMRTKSDLYDYCRKAWTMENYQAASVEQRKALEATFKLINNCYFGNTTISELRVLIGIMEFRMADFYAARATILKFAENSPDSELSRKLLKLLNKELSLQDMNNTIKYLKTTKETSELFAEFAKAFDVRYGYQAIDMEDARKYWLIAAMNRFDGTFAGAGKLASDVRVTAIKDMQTEHNVRTRLGKEGEKSVDYEDIAADTNNVLDDVEYKSSDIYKTEDKYDWLLEHYIAQDLDGKSWKSTAERNDAYRKSRKKYEDKLDELSDEEIDAAFQVAIDDDEVGRKVKSTEQLEEVKRGQIITVRNTYDRARNFARNIIRKLTAEQLAVFVDEHPDLGITKDGKYHYPQQQKIKPTDGAAAMQNILLMRRDFATKMEEAYQEVLDGKYGSKNEQKIIEKQKKRIEKLTSQLEEAMSKKGKKEKVEIIVQGDGKITASDSATIPTILQRVFETTFGDTYKTEVKYLSEEGEVHFVRNYATFVEQNAEALSGMDVDDINEILNFYETYAMAPSGTANETFAQFNAIRQFMLMYVYKLGSDNIIPLTTEQRVRIEQMFKAIKSGAGTELSISRTAQEIINPTEVIFKSLQRTYGVEVDDADIDEIRNIVSRNYANEAKQEGISQEEYRMRKFNEVLRKIEIDTMAKLKGKPRNKIDTILKWQRAAMLSSIGTWVRNASSNVLLRVTNNASDIIGDATFGLLDKVTKNGEKRKMPTDQYKLTGTKLDKADASDKVILDWIDTNVRASGIMDLIGDGMTKYDATATSHTNMSPADIIAQLIINTTVGKLSNETMFPEGNHWWTKAIGKTGNAMVKLLYGYVDSKGKLHRGVMTDTKAVMKSFYIYLGKMIKEDMTNDILTAADLSQGFNSRKMIDRVADAYVMASWDYMHKVNFFNKLDGLIRQYVGDAGYFIWKQFEPFAAAGWNWFMKGLDYTPIGLAKAIFNYIKLEKYAKRMDENRIKQIGPSSRFATYLVKRQIGSGIIGTIGTIAGCFLTAFGVAGIDDDDGKPKLYIGNLSIDISNVFGTSGLLAGIAMAGAFVQAKSKEQSWFEAVIEGLVSATDSMFIDSVFADVFDIMQSRETFVQVLINKTGNSFAMFVPNLLKSALSYSTVVTPKYRTGILGQLERQMVTTLPSLAYALPKRYDIYTGELQYKYNMPWLDRWADALIGTVVNYGSPVKVKRRIASKYEVLATSLGIGKGELTGQYSDIGRLNAEQIGQLNLYYGQLNNTSLEQLVNNRTKFTVENEQGKRVTLSYSQMTDKQKKSVITRIMSDNAKYAKAYIATNMGYKYYTNETDFAALTKLGIRNVYIKSSLYDGFVK